MARALGYSPLTLEAAVMTGYATPYSTGTLEQMTLDDLFGIADHITVNRAKAMTLAPVAKGRRVIAGNIGRLSLVTTKDGLPAPTQMSLLAQPERDRPLAATLTWTADALMFYPRTWWVVMERDFYGWPAWVKVLPQEDAELDLEGHLVKAWGQPLSSYQGVIQFDGVDAGLLIDGADTIRRALIINRAASLAEDNPVPALDIHNDGEDLTKDEIDTLLDSWQAARRRRGVGYSSRSVKVTPLGLPTEQLLIEGRKAITLELSRHMGLPAWAVDAEVAGASMTYTNRASRNWELLDLGLAAPMTAISSRLSMGDVTPRGWAVEFNHDQLTRDDMKTRFETYKIGRDGGFITQAQIDAWEGWATTNTPGGTA